MKIQNGKQWLYVFVAPKVYMDSACKEFYFRLSYAILQDIRIPAMYYTIR